MPQEVKVPNVPSAKSKVPYPPKRNLPKKQVIVKQIIGNWSNQYIRSQSRHHWYVFTAYCCLSGLVLILETSLDNVVGRNHYTTTARIKGQLCEGRGWDIGVPMTGYCSLQITALQYVLKPLLYILEYQHCFWAYWKGGEYKPQASPSHARGGKGGTSLLLTMY